MAGRQLMMRQSTLSDRLVANQVITGAEILSRLERARTWMLNGMGKGVFKTAEKWFNIDSRTITEENFNIIEKAITEAKNHEELFMVEDLTAGPALPYVFKANAITWIFFFLMTNLAYHLVDVDEYGMALPPQTLFLALCILLFIAMATSTLFYESCAGLFVLPTQLIYVDQLALFGRQVSFKTWSLVMLIISFILHSDVYTTALFVGRVVRSTYACDELEAHWRRSVQSGVLKHIPFMDTASFFQLTMLAWFIMFLQLGYALAYSYPISPDISKLSPVLKTFAERRASPAYERVTEIAKSAVYRTLLRSEAGHGRASAALAESGRMMSINWHDDDYLQNAELQWGCVRVHQEMRRANVRFVLFALQSILIPNLQITFLGVQKTVNNGPVDWLTTCSVILTVTCGLKYIVYEVQSCSKHRRFAANAIERHMKLAEALNNNAQYFEAVQVERKAKFSYFFNLAFCFTAMSSFVFLLVKAVMAMTYCETGMWNFNTNLPAGCVHFPSNQAVLMNCSQA